MRVRLWSILLIKSDLKWCIHLSRSLFLYFKEYKRDFYIPNILQSVFRVAYKCFTLQKKATLPRINQLKRVSFMRS